MDLNAKLNRKKLLIIAGFLALAVIAVFSFIYLLNYKNIPEPAVKNSLVSAPANEIQGQDAESLALPKAKEWRADAALAYMASEPIVDQGTESWRLIYVSPTLKNSGYEIIIKDKQVFSAKEIDYAGRGEEFPANPKISQAQAIEKVKKMPGYENAEILSIDAVYGAGTKTWYWGIKTSKGVVSIEMK